MNALRTVGVDISKKTFDVARLDENGKFKHKKFTRDADSFAAFLKRNAGNGAPRAWRGKREAKRGRKASRSRSQTAPTRMRGGMRGLRGVRSPDCAIAASGLLAGSRKMNLALRNPEGRPRKKIAKGLSPLGTPLKTKSESDKDLKEKGQRIKGISPGRGENRG
jgi:hypothetical protein